MEYATSVKLCLYLYNYFFKGTKKNKVIGVIYDDDDENRNKIHNIYCIYGRYLCSMDAFGRVLRYCNYPN